MAKEYISLQEATKFCNYSQEYLSLRARQGKLKAVKFGRNWVTKKEWLEEYSQGVEEYNNQFKAKKFVAPPENLPVEVRRNEEIFKTSDFRLRTSFVFALVFVLLITSSFFGKESFRNIYEDLSPRAQMVREEFNQRAPELAEDIFSFTYQLATVNTPEFLESTLELFREYIQWLAQQPFVIGKKIVRAYITADEFLEEKIRKITLPKLTYQKIVNSILNWLQSIWQVIKNILRI